MGTMTEIIIAVSCSENTAPEDTVPVYPALEFLRARMKEAHRGYVALQAAVAFPQPDQTAICFVGEFKNLVLDSLVEAVRDAPWEYKELVQLFVRIENIKNERFFEIDPFEADWEDRL